MNKKHEMVNDLGISLLDPLYGDPTVGRNESGWIKSLQACLFANVYMTDTDSTEGSNWIKLGRIVKWITRLSPISVVSLWMGIKAGMFTFNQSLQQTLRAIGRLSTSIPSFNRQQCLKNACRSITVRLQPVHLSLAIDSLSLLWIQPPFRRADYLQWTSRKLDLFNRLVCGHMPPIVSPFTWLSEWIRTFETRGPGLCVSTV